MLFFALLLLTTSRLSLSFVYCFLSERILRLRLLAFLLLRFFLFSFLSLRRFSRNFFISFLVRLPLRRRGPFPLRRKGDFFLLRLFFLMRALMARAFSALRCLLFFDGFFSDFFLCCCARRFLLRLRSLFSFFRYFLYPGSPFLGIFLLRFGFV